MTPLCFLGREKWVLVENMKWRRPIWRNSQFCWGLALFIFLFLDVFEGNVCWINIHCAPILVCPSYQWTTYTTSALCNKNLIDPTLLSDFLQDSLVADFFWNTHLGISIFASSSDSPLRTPKHPVPFRPLQSIVQVLKVCDVKNGIPEQSTLLRIFSPITGFSAIFQIYLKCSWDWYVLYACSLVLIYWSIYGWNMVTWVCFKIIGKGAS